MTSRYEISSLASSHSFGIYAAQSPEDALSVMWTEAAVAEDERDASAFSVVEVEHDFTEGERVEGGEGEDYDIGTVDSIEARGVMVRWDSGVTTYAPASILRRAAA